jgi:hypothetical protein
MAQVTPAAAESIRAAKEAARTRHGVRLVDAKDEGTGIASLPNGVYGFTYSPGMESPLFATEKYHSYEIHKLSDGSVRILGFVTAEKKAELESNNDILELQVFPTAWADSDQFVVIPGEWVVGAPKAPREDGNPVNFRLVPVR